MGDVLALGLTHYPLLAGVDDHMADLLKAAMRDPDIPAEAKDVANWKPLAQQEWADDGGTKAAGVHRQRLLDGLKRCRAELDAFKPDVLLVWGDDQYENFREEVIPSFCVLVYGNTRFKPFGVLNFMKVPNVWGLPSDEEFEIQGSPDFAKSLARDVLGHGVDVAYSYEKRDGLNFPHAFANTQVFLDWDSAGAELSLPDRCPCGELLRRARHRPPGWFRAVRIDQDRWRWIRPGPTPLRCFEFGQAVGSRFRTATSGSLWSLRRVGHMHSSTTRNGTCAPTPTPTRCSTTRCSRGTTTLGLQGDHEGSRGSGAARDSELVCLLGAVYSSV